MTRADSELIFVSAVNTTEAPPVPVGGRYRGISTSATGRCTAPCALLYAADKAAPRRSNTRQHETGIITERRIGYGRGGPTVLASHWCAAA